jgi:hypothetical protein
MATSAMGITRVGQMCARVHDSESRTATSEARALLRGRSPHEHRLAGIRRRSSTRDLFEAVQAKGAASAVARRLRPRSSPAILTGRIFDDRGNRMSPTHGDVNIVGKKHNSATIVPDVKRFCRQINTDGVFGTHCFLTPSCTSTDYPLCFMRLVFFIRLIRLFGRISVQC